MNNDVRVNRFRCRSSGSERPIPDVLKTEFMDPIGASDTWKWIGYDNADVDIDGKMMKSVPGGTRWGGGIWMSSRDHARFGLLMARGGNWNGKQLVSSSWIKEATTRGGPPNSNDYGYLWWLNTKGGARGVPTTLTRRATAGHDSSTRRPGDRAALARRRFLRTRGRVDQKVIGQVPGSGSGPPEQRSEHPMR